MRALSFAMWLTIAVLLTWFMIDWAHATDWYVDNSCGTNGNGSTEVCGTTGPWNSMSNAANCTEMLPGDAMLIKDSGGVYREGGNIQLGSNCSGVTIKWYPGDDVILDGTEDISGSTWTHVGGNVYECTAGTCGTPAGQFPPRAWYDVGDATERTLDMIQSNETCDTSLAAGKMRYDSANDRVCAHLFDDSSPADADYFYIPVVAAIMNVRSASVTSLTVGQDPASSGSLTFRRSRRYGLNADGTNTNLVVRGITFEDIMDRSIATADNAGAGPLTFRDNTLTGCGQECIRCDLIGDCRVFNNTMSDIQKSPKYELCQGVGSGCQQGFGDNGTGIRCAASTCTIYGNTISDGGGGYQGEVRGINLEFDAPNSVVHSNLVYGLQGTTGRCIMLSGQNGDGQGGSSVYNNRIYDCDYGITSSTNGTLTHASPILLEYNTILNMDVAAIQLPLAGTDTQTYTIRNNIFASTDADPTEHLITIPSASTNVGTPTYNLYYCPTCAGTIVDFKGTTYTSGTINTLDSNGIYGDSSLTVGDPPALTIDSDSVGLNQGLCGAIDTDYVGTTRPLGPGCDMGAHELTEGYQTGCSRCQ